LLEPLCPAKAAAAENRSKLFFASPRVPPILRRRATRRPSHPPFVHRHRGRLSRQDVFTSKDFASFSVTCTAVPARLCAESGVAAH
jgi:hypothetical protein